MGVMDNIYVINYLVNKQVERKGGIGDHVCGS